MLGLLGHAVGAIAMTLAQGLAAVIVFWAIVGGLGASLLLPAMQSLIVLEYDAMGAGLSIAPLSLSMFAVALLAGRRSGDRPSRIVQLGFGLLLAGTVALLPIMPRAESGWSLLVPLMIAGSGLGLLVSQPNNYTLSPRPSRTTPR